MFLLGNVLYTGLQRAHKNTISSVTLNQFHHSLPSAIHINQFPLIRTNISNIVNTTSSKMLMHYVAATYFVGFFEFSASKLVDKKIAYGSLKLEFAKPDQYVVPDMEMDGRRRGGKSSLRIRNEHGTAFDSEGALRIRGGSVTDTRNFPYMAAIIINGRLWCAGAIVDENWVVTAAHCLNYVLQVSPMKSLSQFVKVRVGSPRAHEGGTLVDVVGAVRHPKFEEEPVPHADVALLKLSENLEFNNFVNLIKIYEGMTEPFAQSFIVLSGWGTTRGSDTAFRDHTSDLLTARLKVRSKYYCIDSYQLVNGFQFTNDFFCASLRNGTRDACLFDAGAPAVQQNRLMGIMSFGPERCGHEYQPAVFIKAFYIRDFVKTTIASYKTTADIIEAMKEVDPMMRPYVKPEKEVIVHKEVQDSDNQEDVTLPDDRHD